MVNLQSIYRFARLKITYFRTILHMTKSRKKSLHSVSDSSTQLKIFACWLGCLGGRRDWSPRLAGQTGKERTPCTCVFCKKYKCRLYTNGSLILHLNSVFVDKWLRILEKKCQAGID